MENKEKAIRIEYAAGSEAKDPVPAPAMVEVEPKDEQVVEPDQDHLQLIQTLDDHYHGHNQQEVSAESSNNMHNINNTNNKIYGPYQCPRCSRICNSSQAFAGHMRGHYSSRTLALNIPVFKPPRERLSSSNNNPKSQTVMPAPPPLSLRPVMMLPSHQPPAATPTATLLASSSSSPMNPPTMILPTTTIATVMATTMANCSPLLIEPSQSMITYLFGDINPEPLNMPIRVSDHFSPLIRTTTATATTTVRAAGTGVAAGIAGVGGRGGANNDNISRISMGLKSVATSLAKQRQALALLHACNVKTAARLESIEREVARAITMAGTSNNSSINANDSNNPELRFQPNPPIPARVNQQVDRHRQQLGLDLDIGVPDNDQRSRVHREIAETIHREKPNNIANSTDPADGHGEEELLDLSLRL